MDLAEFEEIDIIVGTFGKATASVGAFCAVSSEIRDYAINLARSFIFSTALPPINCAWTDFIVERLPEMKAERAKLQQLEDMLFARLQTLPEAIRQACPSHIIPIIVGDPQRTLDLSARLLAEGFKVLPIRTPTVPPGTERLRISLSAALTSEQLQQFSTVLCKSL